MNYIVFDLEWNQPANETQQVTEPVYLTGEIIEIGAVKLNEKFETVDELRLYIKPIYYQKMHRKIASLTGINDRCLEEQGLPFPEACRQFEDWCGEDCGFMTWSDSDQPVLIENMLLHGLDVSHMPPCYDVQRIFDRELMRGERQYSLDAALEVLGEKGDKAHDALHDARNTVLVISHLELDTYLSEYESQAFSEPPILKTYASQQEALHDERLRDFPCPWCGETVHFDPWIPASDHRHGAMGTCGEGDELLMYLSCLPHPRGGVRVSRLVYDMSDDLYDRYQDRVEAQEAGV